MPGIGIYFGVITRDPESRPPGTIATSYQCPALWIDNDVTPKAELQAALLGCYMPPLLRSSTAGAGCTPTGC